MNGICGKSSVYYLETEGGFGVRQRWRRRETGSLPVVPNPEKTIRLKQLATF